MKIVLASQFPIYWIQKKMGKKSKIFGHPTGWVVNLANALSQIKNVDLNIVTLNPQINKSKIIKLNNIIFYLIKNGVPFLHKGFPNYFPLDVLLRFHFDIKAIIKVIKIINPDIVHAFGTEGPYSLAGYNSGYPCLISLQGIINKIFKFEPSLRFLLIRRTEKLAIMNNKYFSCRTKFDRNFILSINKNANIFDIPEAMNEVYFENSWEVKNINRIIFVGSLIKRKGIETLIKAIPLVKKKIPDLVLYIIGNGNSKYKQYLISLCNKFDIYNNVKFLGYKQPKEIVEYLIKSQIFVFPSEIENSPNVIAEAMVLGLPVLATKVGGIPYIIESGKSGILVEKENSQILSEKIIYLLRNPSIRMTIGENAKQIARNLHHPKDVAIKTISAYNEILECSKNG